MIVLAAAFAYALYAGGMYAEQMRMFFPGVPPRPVAATLPAGTQAVKIPAAFGNVRALFVPAAGPGPAPAIVFTHGNLDRANDYAQALLPLAAQGVGILALEYPGYDGADGSPDVTTLGQATTAAYDWLARRRGVDPARIVGMGYSTGGGVIADLARLRKLRALVLISTYTSTGDMAHRYLLPAWLARLPYDTRRRAQEFDGPVLVVHGRRDRVIPFVNGEQIARAAHDGELVAFDCGHDDCGLAEQLFRTRLAQWLIAKGLLAKDERSARVEIEH